MTGPVLPCSDELAATVEALRPGLWFARVRDLWPQAEPLKGWQQTVPAHVVVAVTAAAMEHYRDQSVRRWNELAAATETIRGLEAACRQVLAALPTQTELPL